MNSLESEQLAELRPIERLLPVRLRQPVRQAFALWNRYLWLGLAVQMALGLLLLVLAVKWTQPYLVNWGWVLALVVVACGAFAGRLISRRIEIRWTDAGAAFHLPSLWRALLLLIPIFVLRGVLLLLRPTALDLVPLRRILLFFVPAMLTARAISLMIKMTKLRQAFVRQSAPDSSQDQEPFRE